MAKPKPAIALGQEAREIEKLLRANSHRHDLWSVWSDWVEMQALAISNACDLAQYDEREARYMQIVGRYDAEHVQRMGEAAGLVALALDRNPWQDFLGALFMGLELGNKWAGQFFTPYSLTSVMSRMTLGDVPIPECGFVTISDPCIGGGAMAIGACEAMAGRFEDWNWKLHITGQDIDLKAVHMAYIALSWIGAPAVIIHGNTLALEQRSIWFTPGHVYGGWNRKLRRQRGEQLPAHAEQVPQMCTVQQEESTPAEKPRMKQKQMEFAL